MIALDFIQTTVLEMGQPTSVRDQADPAMWVLGRQFTGRIVTVSNGMIFDEPVQNGSTSNAPSTSSLPTSSRVSIIG